MTLLFFWYLGFWICVFIAMKLEDEINIADILAALPFWPIVLWIFLCETNPVIWRRK